MANKARDLSLILDRDVSRGSVPDPKNFLPTREQPIKEMAFTNAAGDEITVYGVKETGEGLTGPQLSTRVTWAQWHWFTDQVAALAEANYFLYREDPPFLALLDAKFPTPCVGSNLVRSLEVVPRFGSPIQIFVVLVADADGFRKWRVCAHHEVCEIVHKTLLDLRPYTRVPIPAVDVLQRSDCAFPDLVVETLGLCPYCGGDVQAYGAFRWFRHEFGWSVYLDRSKAEACHAEIRAHVAALQRNKHDQDKGVAMRAMALSILSDARNLRISARYSGLRAKIDQDLVAEFEAGYGRGGDLEDLDRYAYFERVTKAVTQALDDYELSLRLLIEGQGLVGRLRAILTDCLSNCPLCGQLYTWSDAWLEEALVVGYTQQECPYLEWYKTAKSLQPKLVREVEHLRHQLQTVTIGGRNNQVKTHGIGMPGNELVEVYIDTYRLNVTLTVRRDALATFNGKAQALCHWPTVRDAALNSWAKDLEKSIASGHVHKLCLRYNEKRDQWNALQRDASTGRKTLYVVSREVAEERRVEFRDRMWCYCYEVARPPSSRHERTSFVLVVPVIEVPEQYLPREQSRERRF